MGAVRSVLSRQTTPSEASAPPNRPLFACANTQIGNALSSAEGFVLCVAGGKVPPSTSGFATMLPYAPRLRRIALLAAIGGSTGGTGGLGEGEGLRKCEEEVLALAAAADVEVSVVRVGALKGGGSVGAADAAGLDAGAFYASLCTGGCAGGMRRSSRPVPRGLMLPLDSCL